jgi:hypothetical protein
MIKVPLRQPALTSLPTIKYSLGGSMPLKF